MAHQDAFPEPMIFLQDAAERLLFPTYHALSEYLRRHPELSTKRYLRQDGGVRYKRVLTASECHAILARRFATELPRERNARMRAPQAGPA